jgi:hypothetical protein
VFRTMDDLHAAVTPSRSHLALDFQTLLRRRGVP